MTTATLLNLENSLSSTLLLIESLQIQKQEIEVGIVSLNNKITEFDIIIAQHPYMASWGTIVQGYDAANSALENQETRLSDTVANLNAALNQKVLDQEAIRDYKISNMSPEELGAFIEVEQNALQSAELFKYQKQVLIVVGIVALIVGLLFLFKFLKKKKLIKK